MTGLDDRLSAAVGGRAATALERAFGMRTVGDLLRHYPRRYAARGELTELRSLRVGEQVTVLGEVCAVQVSRLRNRPGYRVSAQITDGRDRLRLAFFPRKEHQAQYWARVLQPGRQALFAGTVSVFRRERQLAHPEVHPLDGDPGDRDSDIEAFAGALIPVYPAVRSLPTWTIARTVGVALATLGEVPDPIPAEVRHRLGLLDLGPALVAVHRPRTREQAAAARHRLRFEEAFVLQTVLALRRRDLRALPAVSRLSTVGGLLREFDLRLPYDLTAGQQAVGAQIEQDLARTHPMHRLLQGEVGSGKTVVAVRAMLAVVDAGGQAALLAPTEVLAQQHHRSITALLGPLAERGRLGGSDRGTRVALLTGSQGSARRRRELADVVSGEAGIVVGTHALLEEHVAFHDLALVVVDEQHRFGVEQRAALSAKSRDGTRPHVLVMTATPIPRTVAMTVFGDLDVSTLTELPRGRAPIATHVVPEAEKPAYLARGWDRIREEVAAGHKAYVVCPRIGGTGPAGPEDDTGGGAYDPPPAGPADAHGAAAGTGDVGRGAEAGLGTGDEPPRPPLAVLDVWPRLVDGPLRGLRVGLLHGRLPAEDKERAMHRFALPGSDPDALDVLVSTTVIEVGVDVPAATVMVVLDADRFGISQLHQLRGRVGRGDAPGLCLLVTEAPDGSPARARLAEVAGTVDGFALSRLDLRLRREGDVLGASQSGRRSSLRLLEVLRHEDLVAAARDEASALVDADPDLRGSQALRQAVAALAAEDRSDYLEKA